MSLEVLGPRSVNVSWDDNEPRTIMVISDGITAEVSIGELPGVSWHAGVTSPFKLENLKVDQPVYVALQQDDVITAWSSTTPRKWIADGEIKTIQQMENGNIFLGGDFEYIAPDHGSAVLLPSASSGIANPTPLAFPHVNGLVYSAVDDGQGGWFIGGNFTKVGNHEKPGFAHIDRMGQVLPWQPVEGDIRQIKKRNGILYIGGTYKTVSNSYLVALSAFEINNDTPEFHVELADPAGYPEYPTYVNQVELAKDRIYVHGHINFPDNIVAIDYNGNILNWPTELIDFFSPLKIVTFNNDLYIQTEVFMLPFFYKIDAAGKAGQLSFDLPGERLWGIFSDSEYLYINIAFNAAAIGEKPAGIIRLDAQGNRSFLNIPSSQIPHGTTVVHDEIIYYINRHRDEQQVKLRAFSLKDNKDIPWATSSYPSTVSVSDDTVLISSTVLFAGRTYRPGQAVLNENEELLPEITTDSSGTRFHP
ncbi:hypothetical protein C4F51_05765 [Cellvibrio sp. KB43]|uniref:Uncharacterized protein n=2 Tax=Cellvibrio polysaccharolyticus TaxID=2082724 RepID=A0A928V4Z0_9GAMM|nr:hypothetical protein [Cellvibrio polysaccharolyticus]